MAKNSRRKLKSNKKLLVSTIALVILLAGLGVWQFRYHKNSNYVTTSSGALINHSPATQAENQENNNRKTSSSPSSTLENSSTASNTSSPASFTVTENVNINSGNIHVGTLVNGTTGGDCSLVISQPGQQSVERSSNVTQDVNSYDCGVFNIPTSDLAGGGQWTVTLTVTNNGQQASSSTKINI